MVTVLLAYKALRVFVSLVQSTQFTTNLQNVPRSGVHNPFKNPERYNMLGDVSAAAARELRKPEVTAYFTALIQRVVGKSIPQCEGEVTTVMKFLENFCSDNVRQLARGFNLPGDHAGTFVPRPCALASLEHASACATASMLCAVIYCRTTNVGVSLSVRRRQFDHPIQLCVGNSGHSVNERPVHGKPPHCQG